MTSERRIARSEYLVDAAWIEDHKDDADVVIVDVDEEAGYLRGHVAGAIMLSHDYERDPDTGWVRTLPAAEFAATCENLGIGDGTLVIVYDNNMSLYAARLWWVLNYYGHTEVKVLDGGWRHWVEENRPISFDRSVPRAKVTFTPITDTSILGRLDELKAACGRSDAVVWDVRTGGEYDGSVSRGNRRTGHIAGAVHLEWSDLMNRGTHCFKSLEEIRLILTEKGITPDKAVFAY